MRSKTKVALVSMLIITIASVTYASILVQKQITSSMRIERAVAMEIFDTDAETPLTSIALGDFLWNTMYYYPGKTETEPIEGYYAVNTDQMDFYVMFEIADVPEPNVNFFIRFQRLDKTWTSWGNPGVVYDQPLISQVNDPDPNVQACRWQLQVCVYADVPFGDFTPTITFTAVSTPTG